MAVICFACFAAFPCCSVHTSAAIWGNASRSSGLEFDEQTYRENGHIQVDFGLDTPFLGGDVELTPFVEQRVRANVHKLVEFTSKVEKHLGVTGRVLWSESEENLAQKLISRLQKVQ